MGGPARSKHLAGPYEVHPDKHLVSSPSLPDAPLLHSGHGDFVETQDGETYLVHLIGRPVPGLSRCPIFDASLLSDEAGRGKHGNFTVAFVGMQAMDGGGTGYPADFDFFTYKGMPWR